MDKRKITDIPYGEFQKKLVEYVIKKLDDQLLTSTPAFVYFPMVTEKVEAFLLVHWKWVREDCSHFTWAEWKKTECYSVFHDEVIKETMREVSIK
ncbi:hypothetical protein [Evansella tamaricis]|uniref:Uncharacterized protein n=1 Tax=Evansella tamaricis TaxID=2069301 RepID=A0ABS6JJM9_9BACI|nr:hypothetical protein [Evansella tamaricis]MBU9712655.1 hypothetical protein [Evansella tamaricis]